MTAPSKASSDRCRCTSGVTDPPCTVGEQHICDAAQHGLRLPHTCRCGVQWGERQRPVEPSPIPKHPAPWHVAEDKYGNTIVEDNHGGKVAGDVTAEVATLIVRLINTSPSTGGR